MSSVLSPTGLSKNVMFKHQFILNSIIPQTLTKYFLRAIIPHKTHNTQNSMQVYMYVHLGGYSLNLLTMKRQWTYGPTLLPWFDHFHTSLACFTAL